MAIERLLWRNTSTDVVHLTLELHNVVPNEMLVKRRTWLTGETRHVRWSADMRWASSAFCVTGQFTCCEDVRPASTRSVPSKYSFQNLPWNTWPRQPGMKRRLRVVSLQRLRSTISESRHRQLAQRWPVCFEISCTRWPTVKDKLKSMIKNNDLRHDAFELYVNSLVAPVARKPNTGLRWLFAFHAQCDEQK